MPKITTSSRDARICAPNNKWIVASQSKKSTIAATEDTTMIVFQRIPIRQSQSLF